MMINMWPACSTDLQGLTPNLLSCLVVAVTNSIIHLLFLLVVCLIKLNTEYKSVMVLNGPSKFEQ